MDTPHTGSKRNTVLQDGTRTGKNEPTGNDMRWTGNHVQADRRMRSADLVAGEALIETALAASDVRQCDTRV